MGFEDELAAERTRLASPDPAPGSERARVGAELRRLVAEYAVPAARALTAGGVRKWDLVTTEDGPSPRVPASVQRVGGRGWRLGTSCSLVLTETGELRGSSMRQDVTRESRQPRPAAPGSWSKNGDAWTQWAQLGRLGLEPGETLLAYGEPLDERHLSFCTYSTHDSLSIWWLDTAGPELCLRYYSGDDVTEPLRSAVLRGTAALLQDRPHG